MGSTEDRVLQLIDAMQSDECSLRQAAVILGRTYPTLVSYRKKGHIRAVHKGSQWIVNKAELRRFHVYGNYVPNSPTLDSITTNIVQPLPIKHDSDGGFDLSALSQEERDSLGSESVLPHKPKIEV